MTDTITLPRSVVEQAISTILELEYSNSTAVSDKMARDSKAALRAALEQPQDIAYHEAVSLAKWLFRKHFAHEEDYASGCVVWGPCDTTVGVISQIENMVCGLVRQQPPRQPLTDQQINDHRLALAYDSEDLPDPWDFKQGVRAAERAHGIGGEK